LNSFEGKKIKHEKNKLLSLYPAIILFLRSDAFKV